MVKVWLEFGKVRIAVLVKRHNRSVKLSSVKPMLAQGDGLMFWMALPPSHHATHYYLIYS